MSAFQQNHPYSILQEYGSHGQLLEVITI